MKITNSRLTQIIQEEIYRINELKMPDPAQSSQIVQNIISLIESGQLKPNDIAQILPALSVANARIIVASLSAEVMMTTAGAMVQAGAALAIVLALFGSFAFLFYYPLSTSAESPTQLKRFARDLQHPVRPRDFGEDEASRHLEFIALAIEDFKGTGGNIIRDLISNDSVQLLGQRYGETIPAIDKEFVVAAREYSERLKRQVEASSDDDFGTLIELFPEIEVEQEVDDELSLDECIPLAKIIHRGGISTGTRRSGTLSFPVLNNMGELLEYLNTMIFFFTRHFKDIPDNSPVDALSIRNTQLPLLETIRGIIEKILEDGCVTLRDYRDLISDLKELMKDLDMIALRNGQFEGPKGKWKLINNAKKLLSNPELTVIQDTMMATESTIKELNYNLLHWVSTFYPKTARDLAALDMGTNR